MRSTSAGGDFDYDANGNMTRRRTTSTAPVQTLAWSGANELLSVTTGTTVESYRYDEEGQRIYQESKTGGNLTWQHFDYFPHYTVGITATQAVTKTYFFGGQPVAQRVGGKPLTYLHADHLGSTVLTTGVSGNQKYHAYGATRSGLVKTEHQFTGHELDSGTGLIYMRARYYDPVIGQFISPDTIVPDPNNLYAYNRYMYAYGNPLKYSDPGGHCATLSNGEPDSNDAECWTLARTIYAQWDGTDYWADRWGDKDVFMNYIAPTESLDAAFFQEQWNMFLNSEQGKEWLAGGVERPYCCEQDFGDYTSVTASYTFFEVSTVVDDFGTAYVRLGIGPATQGFSITRGDVFVTESPDATWADVLSGRVKTTDIDALGLTREQKRALMQDLMVGNSSGGSLGGHYLVAGIAKSSSSVSVEAGFGGKGGSGSLMFWSYTLQLPQ